MTPVPPSIVTLRVSARCASLAEFSERYWRLLCGERILLMAARARPPGTRVRFAIALADGSEVLRGQGSVLRSVDRDGAVWLEVMFTPLDEASHKLATSLRALRTLRAGASSRIAAREFDDETPTTRFDRDALAEFERHPTSRIPRGRAVPPPLPDDVVDEIWRSLPTANLARLRGEDAN